MFTVTLLFFFCSALAFTLFVLTYFHSSHAALLQAPFLFLKALFVNGKRRRMREQIMKHRSAFHTLFRKNSPMHSPSQQSSHFFQFWPHFGSLDDKIKVVHTSSEPSLTFILFYFASSFSTKPFPLFKLWINFFVYNVVTQYDFQRTESCSSNLSGDSSFPLHTFSPKEMQTLRRKKTTGTFVKSKVKLFFLLKNFYLFIFSYRERQPETHAWNIFNWVPWHKGTLEPRKGK